MVYPKLIKHSYRRLFKMKNTLLPYKGVMPKINEKAFIAQTASIIGDVEIGADSGIWYGCVVRGDVNEIRIGERTNIQDLTMIHVAQLGQGTYIGDGVTVGHSALLHACTIKDRAIIGLQACVMDDCVIEEKAWVAAGALVTPGKVVKSGEVWAGRPAKKLRDMSDKEYEFLSINEDRYVDLAREYLDEQYGVK